MNNISIDEFYELFSNLGQNDLILDVRSPGEFADGHIPGARNTPHDDVAALSSEISGYDNVFVHCKMGGRAKMAAQTLRDLGAKNIICVADGGMQRWMDMQWPVE